MINERWLTDYAEFIALCRILTGDSLEWTAKELDQARTNPEFENYVYAHKYAQWIGHGQLKDALKLTMTPKGRSETILSGIEIILE